LRSIHPVSGIALSRVENINSAKRRPPQAKIGQNTKEKKPLILIQNFIDQTSISFFHPIGN
jgi:hypothetical protein